MEFLKETELRDSEAGRVPKNWDTAKLSDVIKEAKPGFASGKRDEKGILQLRMNSIQIDGKINIEGGVKVPIPPNATEYFLTRGDVLFNNTNSVDLIGKTAVFKNEFSNSVYSNHLTRLRVDNSRVTPEWITYTMIRKWQLGVFKAMCHRHVHQAGINKSDLLSIKIPVPSLFEQRGVTELLGVVDSAIELADKVIAKTERLKKGLMQKLLTEGIGHTECKNTPIGKTPKTWQVVRIRDIAETSSGGTPSRSKKEYFDGEIPWVKSGELKDNTLYATEETISNEGLQNSAAKIFPKGTLLIALYGATVGKTAILGIDATTNQAVCAILPKGDTINPEFLKYYIVFRREQLIAVSAGGAQPNISQEIIRFKNVPLPQPQEQRKIAEILLTLDKKLEIERAEMAKLENTKHGLMDLLLTGKIRVRMD
jgi:type I restriction enzyme S subunit